MSPSLAKSLSPYFISVKRRRETLEHNNIQQRQASSTDEQAHKGVESKNGPSRCKLCLLESGTHNSQVATDRNQEETDTMPIKVSAHLAG